VRHHLFAYVIAGSFFGLLLLPTGAAAACSDTVRAETQSLSPAVRIARASITEKIALMRPIYDAESVRRRLGEPGSIGPGTTNMRPDGTFARMTMDPKVTDRLSVFQSLSTASR
jgi:hypothetical protein